MKDYIPRQDDAADEAEMQEQPFGGLPGELIEESDPAFMAETSRPGRNATMVLVALLILGAGAIYFMRMKAGPQTAAAATPEAADATKTISLFLNDGGKNIKSMHDLLKNTERIVQQFLSYPSKTQVALEELKTNPFLFTKPTDPTAEDSVEKRQREEAQRKLAEKQAIASAASQLELQSIMAGGRIPTCMIASRAFTEGQAVNGFVIEKITADGVIVKKSDYRFLLRMKQ